MFCPNCGASVPSEAAFCDKCGTALITPQPPAEPFPANPPEPLPAVPPPAQPPVMPAPAVPARTYGVVWNYASWGDRAIGYIIDSVLVGAAMALIYFVAGTLLTAVAGLGGENLAGGFCCMFLLLFPVASLAVGLYNRVYLIATRGYSIGQGVMKLKTVDSSGGLLTQGTAFLRLLVQVVLGFVPFLPVIDLLWPLWDDRRQTLHDKAVNSYVIYNPDKR